MARWLLMGSGALGAAVGLWMLFRLPPQAMWTRIAGGVLVAMGVVAAIIGIDQYG